MQSGRQPLRHCATVGPPCFQQPCISKSTCPARGLGGSSPARTTDTHTAHDAGIDYWVSNGQGRSSVLSPPFRAAKASLARLHPYRPDDSCKARLAPRQSSKRFSSQQNFPFNPGCATGKGHSFNRVPHIYRPLPDPITFPIRATARSPPSWIRSRKGFFNHRSDRCSCATPRTTPLSSKSCVDSYTSRIQSTKTSLT